MVHNPRAFPARARFVVVVLSLAIVASFVSGAGAAPTKRQVQHAKNVVQRLQAEVGREQRGLAALQVRVGAATDALLQAQDAYDQVTAQYVAVQERLRAAQQQYQQIVLRLNARAHEAFISGSGSNLEFLLGSTSLGDFSDRVEFIDAVAQSDADLAQQVENTKNVLATSAAELANLQAARKAAYLQKKQKEKVLQSNLDQQQQLVDRINSQLAAAKRFADKLSKQYQRWLASQSGPTFGHGTMKACPVDQPRAFGDDFGAPRYAGGFHLHQGNDIVAPRDTPIRAPFDGTASESPNGLGGLAVIVTGSLGYVYNAHLDHYSDHSVGPVHAGDIIGYVGSTGDAQGGVTHDHFEWHPNVIPNPNDWPKSAYGYSVIDTAVNPHPLLVAACL